MYPLQKPALILLSSTSQVITLGHLIDAYIKRHASKRLRTWREIEIKLQKYVNKYWDIPVTAITSEDAEDLHAEISLNGTYMANRVLQYLRSAWNKGRRWGLCPESNPFSTISRFPEYPRERFLSLLEIQRLIIAARSDKHPDIADFIELSLCTMARKSNVLSMSWDEIDLEQSVWVIPACKSKNEKAQTIPLSEREMEILTRRYDGKSQYMFPADSVSGHWIDPRKPWNRVLKRAGIRDLRIHDLRRSGAAALACENVNVSIVMAALNHKSIQTTLSVYAKANQQSQLNARQEIQAKWFQRSSDR